MNMKICSCRGAIRSFVESTAECGAYFTVVHSHGVACISTAARGRSRGSLLSQTIRILQYAQ